MKRLVYVLDANILIQAKNEYYQFDLVPGFWDTLVHEATKGRVRSIDRVKQELKREGEGEQLWDWVNKDFNIAFSSTNCTDVIQAYSKIMNWVHGQTRLRDYAKSEFSKVADTWLVAYALAKQYTVVTHEVYAPNIQKKVKIPNVCVAFGVEYVNTFEMLKRFGVRWGNLDADNETELSG